LAQAPNLISNPSLEASSASLPEGWYHESYGDNTAYFSYLSPGALDESRSFMITMSSWTNGDAKWYFQNIPVTPGKTYYFSDFYKATVPTVTIARYRDASGAKSYERLGADPQSDSWRKSGFAFTAPDDAVVATVFHAIAATGTLQTSGYCLIESTAPAFHRSIVSLTFDDGYRSVHDIAWPILQEYGFKSTHYIVTHEIGKIGMFKHQMMSDRERDSSSPEPGLLDPVGYGACALPDGSERLLPARRRSGLALRRL
jgi:hypothetical protein